MPITRPRRVVYLKRQQFIESGLSTHTSATGACADASRSFSFFLYLSVFARSLSCTCIHETVFYMAARMNERAANEERNEGSRVTDSRVPRLSTEPPR